jgi:NADH-quinone oxidoreductase subunit M
MLSSVGLPSLNGFVGEFLILVGSFHVNWLMTLIATTGVILAAVYLLYMFRRVFFGEITRPENRELRDLVPREVWSVLPLAVMAFVIGLFPTMFLGRVTPDSRPIVQLMDAAEQRAEEQLIARPTLGEQAVTVLLARRDAGGEQ